METQPSVVCPVCGEQIDPDVDLEDHLDDEHSPRELAEWIAVKWESEEFGYDS